MHDMMIVGGGPAGLTAAIYALRAGKSVLVIEKNGFGGQIAFSPKVENIPGIQQISGAQFAEALTEQAMNLGADVEMEKVIRIEKDGDLFKAVENAARLAARLCRKHNITPENIVQHNHWSGKNCPEQLRMNKPYSWEVFLARVSEFLKELPSGWAMEAADWCIEEKIIQGDGTGYNWQRPVSREELAVMLHRFRKSLFIAGK